jgi:hypothetical protein
VPASSSSIRTTEARRGRARSVAGTLQLKLAAVKDPVREPIRSNDPVLVVSCPSRTGRYAVGDFSNARRLRDSLDDEQAPDGPRSHAAPLLDS